MNNYTELDKILHRQFLSNNSLTDFLFSRILHNSKKYKPNKNSHIFITGLARSGTTALLNNFYSSNQFGSMVYSYMPFILFPKFAYFFSKISINQISETERLHNDGIKINLNSPECLDEIFWIKSENKFNNETCEFKKNNGNIIRAYDYFLSKYMRMQKKTRMVIKNNNNHQRLDILANYFSNSFFLLMFREPIFHAYSLLNQHKNFLSLQKKESFILEYMNLIGHREFGNGHVPFVYSNNVYDLNALSNKLEINYWIKQWINTYKSILDSKIYLNKNILLINYRSLCTNKDLFKSICNKLKIKNNTIKPNFKLSKLLNEANHNVEPDILKEANNIYKELNNFSL
tara:strand:+ start:221 stop:1255 length:1035 start_codon:yes stop_codon:yes gene_type:complete